MRSPGMSASAVPSSPRASRWKVSTARVIAGWSARTHGLPGLADAVDVASPGERLVGHGDAGLGGDLADAVQLLGGEVEVVDGVPGWRSSRRAGSSYASSAITPSLVRSRCRTASNGLGRHALDVTDGLEQRDLQPEVGAARGDLAGRERRPDQVVVEELDRVEPGAGGSDELVLEHAAEGDRRDALAHQAVSSLKWCFHPCGVGRPTREVLKGPDGLLDRHPATGEHPAAAGSCGGDERGLQGEVDDVADPEVTAQAGDRDCRARVAEHADRGRVDDTLGAGERGLEIASDADPAGTEAGREPFDARRGASWSASSTSTRERPGAAVRSRRRRLHHRRRSAATRSCTASGSTCAERAAVARPVGVATEHPARRGTGSC